MKNLQVGKFLKIYNKTPINKKKINKIRKKIPVQESFFNKVVGWRHNICIKLLILLLFFILPLTTKSKLFAPFTQCALAENVALNNCLISANVISNVRIIIPNIISNASRFLMHPLCTLRKEFAIFFFYLPYQRKGNTISESLKFTGSIYRILKSQKFFFLAKVLLTKQFNLIDLSCCNK